MKLNNILEFLTSTFPMCDWRIVPMTWSKGQIILWKPSKYFEIRVYSSRYDSAVNDGAEMIIVDWENRKPVSGGGGPCRNYEMLEKSIKGIIEHYNPRLLDAQQLSLF